MGTKKETHPPLSWLSQGQVLVIVEYILKLAEGHKCILGLVFDNRCLFFLLHFIVMVIEIIEMVVKISIVVAGTLVIKALLLLLDFLITGVLIIVPLGLFGVFIAPDQAGHHQAALVVAVLVAAMVLPLVPVHLLVVGRLEVAVGETAAEDPEVMGGVLRVKGVGTELADARAAAHHNVGGHLGGTVEKDGLTFCFFYNTAG